MNENPNSAELWQIARDKSRAVKERGLALAKLVRSADVEVCPYLADELTSRKLSEAWRGQLLFLAERAACKESDRPKLQQSLLRAAHTVFDELRRQGPHNGNGDADARQIALWTALRTYARLTAPIDHEAIEALLDFADPEWPKVSQVCLQGIRSIFAANPPAESVSNRLGDRVCEIINGNLLARDAAHAALLSTAVQAIAVLGDPRLEGISRDVKEGGRYSAAYIAGQLNDLLSTWKREDSGVAATHPARQRLETALEVLGDRAPTPSHARF